MSETIDPIQSIQQKKEAEPPPPTTTFQEVAKSVEAQAGTAAAGETDIENAKVKDMEQLRTDPRFTKFYDLLLKTIMNQVRKDMQRHNDRIKSISRKYKQ